MPSIVACLLFQKRKPLHEIVDAGARPFDPLPQRLVLRLELGVLDRAAPGLQLRFRFLGARTPARQLLRDVTENRFELIDGIPPPTPPRAAPPPPPPPPLFPHAPPTSRA